MKGALLAAGSGSRLYPLTQRQPKPLVKVGERTCLDIVLKALAAVVDIIVVVTGYHGNKITEHLNRHPLQVPVQIVNIPKPEQGNLASLAAMRFLIEGDGFILTNADHLFPSDFYTHHFAASESISIAAQNNRPIHDDEMKVKVVYGYLRGILPSRDQQNLNHL
ncbi:MAG: sugar phosphate nucleotidyltransferase [Planctomycetota bacterium]|jgi:choline kinase